MPELLCGCEGIPCSENREVSTGANGTKTVECGSCGGPCHPYESDEEVEDGD